MSQGHRRPIRPGWPANAAAICAYVLALMCAPVATYAQGPSDGKAVQAPAEQTTRGAYDLLTSGDPKGAAEVFREMLKQNPKDIAAHVGLGEALGALGDLPGSVASHREAVKLNPLSGDLRVGLAGALERAGDLKSAEEELAKAVSLAPTDPRPLVALSGVLRELKRLPEARMAAVRALGWAPDSPAVHMELGAVYEAREDWETAVEAYGAAARLGPGLRPAQLAYVHALGSAKRYAEAEMRSRALLKEAPDDLYVRLALATALDGLGRHDDAIAEYRTIIGADASIAAVWGNLGWTQYSAGKLTDALESSRKALELDPKLVYVLYNVGLIHAVRGEWEAAETAYRKAIELGDPADLRAGLEDVRAAIEGRPEHATLKRAERLLDAALAGSGA